MSPPIGSLYDPSMTLSGAVARSNTKPKADDTEDGATENFVRNSKWLSEGQHTYNTPLPPEQEAQFRAWVTENKIPFELDQKITDYDMRGFWKALQAGDPIAKSAVDPNDKKLHYPDYWKTPYHETFSNESQWANKKTAPHWTKDDKLVAPDGTVLFDDRAKKSKQ